MNGIQNKPLQFQETADTSFFSLLPEEIILKIFTNLNATELAKSGEVNRKWRRLTSDANLWNAIDLRTISPLLKVFDETDWVKHIDLPKYGLSVEDAPSLDKREAIPWLKRSLRSLSIENNEGATLLTIPKGLTVSKLYQITEAAKNSKLYEIPFLHRSKDLPVERAYLILATNGLFEGTRDQPIKDLKIFLKEKGWELFKIIEVTTLLVTTLISSGKRLLNDDPATYTLCFEKSFGKPVLVGSFSIDGASAACLEGDTDHESDTGVGGVLHGPSGDSIFRSLNSSSTFPV